MGEEEAHSREKEGGAAEAENPWGRDYLIQFRIFPCVLSPPGTELFVELLSWKETDVIGQQASTAF